MGAQHRPPAASERSGAERAVKRPAWEAEVDLLSGYRRGQRRRIVPLVDAEPDMVVEDADSGFCGAVVGFESSAVILEDRKGRRRNFPLLPAAFLLDGATVTLRRPSRAADPPRRPRVTASGSVAVDSVAARVARA